MPQPINERSAGHRVVLNRENLWFLYCLLGFIKAYIEDITGWTRAQIDYGIRKWDLSQWSGSSVDTRSAIRERIATAYGIPMTMDRMDEISDLAEAELGRLRQLVLSGEFSWESGESIPAEFQRMALLAAVPSPEEASRPSDGAAVD